MATIDKTKKYFFHNIYGEAQTLIDSLPADTIAIPAGWSAAAETNRDDYVDSIKAFNDNTMALHVGPTDYPTVLYHREAWNQTHTTNVDGTEKEFVLEQLEKKIEDNFKLRQEILKLSKNG